MAKAVLDTNIIIDYLSASRAHHADAVDLLEALLESGEEPVVPAGCIKDTYYILCRHYHNEEIVRERLAGFQQVVLIADLSEEVLDAAFALSEPDLEDGIIRATAELLHASAIITRDKDAYARSFVPSMDARTFCSQLDT